VLGIRHLELFGYGRLQVGAQGVEVALDVHHGGAAVLVNAANLERGHSGGAVLPAGGQLAERVLLQLGQDELAATQVKAHDVGVLLGQVLQWVIKNIDTSFLNHFYTSNYNTSNYNIFNYFNHITRE